MITAVLTDIEGTTSSISFVKDVLFPYARRHLAGYVREHGADAEVAELLDAVNREGGRELTREEAIQQLLAWMDADAKITPLKALQGMIWKQGYSNGDFHGHVYADAVEKLQQWRREKYRLYVYSSGSVPAQKLLFAHTEKGDLTSLFDGYFDTRIGHKRDPASYEKIAVETRQDADSILFLSDIAEELDAAAGAGLRTIQLVRAEDETAISDHHHHVTSFHEIDPAEAG